MTTRPLATLQNAAAATGNGNAYGCADLGTVAMQVTGTFSATVTWEGTTNGVDYVSIFAVKAGTGTLSTTATTTGIYYIRTVGLDYVRARISTWASGSVTVQARGSSEDLDIGTAPLTAGEDHIGQVGGTTAKVVVEKTRPNDTSAYAANDAINESASAGTNWTFAVGRVATGGGLIVAAQVLTDDTTWTARLELDLYDTNPTAINDNAEATRLYANAATYIGSITFPATSKHTTSSTANDAAVAAVNLPYKCLAASSIYGILRTLDAVASPVAQKKYTVILEVAPD